MRVTTEARTNPALWDGRHLVIEREDVGEWERPTWDEVLILGCGYAYCAPMPNAPTPPPRVTVAIGCNLRHLFSFVTTAPHFYVAFPGDIAERWLPGERLCVSEAPPGTRVMLHLLVANAIR